MSEIVPVTDAVPGIAVPQSEDRFEIAFRAAAPALDAVIELWRPLMWLDRRRSSRERLFDSQQASMLVDLIPSDDRLYKIQRLFREAEQDPAVEGWVHVAIGVMLSSIPAAADLSDDYRSGIVDSMYNDPDIWGDYSPGFSSAVIVRAIREARRQEGVPSPARFLELCGENRQKFKQYAGDCNELVHLRHQAESYLREGVRALPSPVVDDPAHPDYCPF